MPDRPLLLAFDTSAAHCAAALLSRDDLLGIHFEARAKGQAEALLPALEALLAKCGAQFSELSALGVGTGPGNFTGLRIAVSAARGLSLGLGIPAIGVSSFETASALSPHDPCEVLLPAPRESAYRSKIRNGQPIGSPDILVAAPASQLTLIDWSDAGIKALARRARLHWMAGDPCGRPAPVYVRPADAAPARDTPPPLLP